MYLILSSMPPRSESRRNNSRRETRARTLPPGRGRRWCRVGTVPDLVARCPRSSPVAWPLALGTRTPAAPTKGRICRISLRKPCVSAFSASVSAGSKRHVAVVQVALLGLRRPVDERILKPGDVRAVKPAAGRGERDRAIPKSFCVRCWSIRPFVPSPWPTYTVGRSSSSPGSRPRCRRRGARTRTGYASGHFEQGKTTPTPVQFMRSMIRTPLGVAIGNKDADGKGIGHGSRRSPPDAARVRA